MKRKRAEYETEHAEQEKELAAIQSIHEQLKSDCIGAAKILDANRKQHASNAEYITSTEAAIDEINLELDSEDFVKVENELNGIQSSKLCPHCLAHR